MKRASLIVVLALLGLAGCERPDWTDPAKSKGPRTGPAAVVQTQGNLQPAPAVPAWAAPMMGRQVADVFKKSEACIGNADAVRQRFAGLPAGAELVGWGWEVKARHRVQRVLLVDGDGRIVGAGEGGRRRLDVPRALKDIPDDHTGWEAVTPGAGGRLTAYGVVGGGTATCALGQLVL